MRPARMTASQGRATRTAETGCSTARTGLPIIVESKALDSQANAVSVDRHGPEARSPLARSNVGLSTVRPLRRPARAGGIGFGESDDDLGGPGARSPVPERNFCRRPIVGPQHRRNRADAVWIYTEYRVCPAFDSNGTLRRASQSEAANSERRGLLLNSAGIGEDEPRLRLQR